MMMQWQHSRDVVEVKPLRELKVQLDGGTLVGAPQGIHDDNINLEWKGGGEGESEGGKDDEGEARVGACTFGP